eukprot:SAG25_NODE_95_length_15927_cov_8.666224_13_plen_50_part_00
MMSKGLVFLARRPGVVIFVTLCSGRPAFSLLSVDARTYAASVPLNGPLA